MKKFLLNYSDSKFKNAQKYNSITGLEIGGFDSVIECSPSVIDDEFKRLHSGILSQPRGGGYWLWKPYIILKNLMSMRDGDVLFYCDSGSHFISSIDEILNTISFDKQPIIPFGVDPHLEKTFTKMDVFVFNECEDNKSITDTPQVCASFQLIKKNQDAVDFYNEVLYQCCNPGLITGMENKFGKNNLRWFVDHRHDQSIYSVLCKLNNYEIFRDPSQYGLWSKDIYTNSIYPQIIEHTRRQD